MPGEPFFHDQTPADGSYLRLNFSHASDADMQRGLRCLARLLEPALESGLRVTPPRTARPGLSSGG